MLDIKWIRENPEALDRALASRGAAPASARLIALDEKRRAHIFAVQTAQERRNAASKEIGKAKGLKDEATASHLMAEVSDIKAFLQGAEETERRFNKELDAELAVIPNVPLDEVPVGADEHANVEKSAWGAKRNLAFQAKEHFELGEKLGQMDFESAAKMSGARFVILKGGLARLERALGQFMLDLHTEEHGYVEVEPPLMVRDEAMRGTGQLPKFGGELFFGASAERRDLQARRVIDAHWLPNDTEMLTTGGRPAEVVTAVFERAPTSEEFWLIPTAEVPLTNLVRESILSEAELPLRFAALTPCFRSEAGAAGRDTRGMLRQHQFNKVELVAIATPEQSKHEHERMLASAEEVLRRLDLHYRVMTLSTGDMGFSAQKTWDIEVWLPGQAAYREISSVSVCGGFQARRMDARYRPAEGKGTRLVHTLNGSGVAVGRALIAVMETYQNGDGSITVPEVLRRYMGSVTKIG